MMKHVLFLQDLGLSRQQTVQMLRQAIGSDEYQPAWIEDASRAVKDSAEIIVTSKHQVGEAELDDFPSVRMVSCAFTGYNERTPSWN